MANTHGAPRRGPGAHGGFEKPKDLKRTVSRLLGYLTKRKWPLFLVLVCLLLSVGTNIGGSTFINLIIINNIAYGGYTGPMDLLVDILKLVGIYLVGVVAVYAQSAIMVQLAQRGTNRLRKDLFDHLQTLPLSYFDKHTHGELMSRFTNDADYVQMALEQSLVSLVSSAIMFVGIVVVMLVVSPLLFLVSVLTLGSTFLVFKVFGGRSRRYYKKQQDALGDVNGNIQEMIEGLKVVKAFTHEEQAKEQFQGLNETYRDAATNASFYSTAVMPISMNIMNVGYALTAAFGGVLSLLAGFKLGSFTLYLGYCRQVGQPLSQISQQLTTILSALAGAERIFDAMDAQPEEDQGVVTLVPAEKDANGTLSAHTGSGRPHTWAWKTPRTAAMSLVPVLREEGNLIELGQAVRAGEGLKLLPPHQDSEESLWVRVEADGALTPIADLSLLSAHGWAWKYADPNGKTTLHLIRGTVRNVPGEDYYLTELKGAVRFTDVDFSYVPGKRILKKINVYANPGQKIAFVGSTGAGKTTITNLINRFYEIEGGMITFDGINVQSIRKDDLRHALGAVLQDTHLFTGTIMDNIRYGRLDATDEECIEAAKIANAHSFIRRLPDGYNTFVTGDGGNLSQGQRQLLAIARAAVADPPVMILDEATSSIDTRTEALIAQGMDALMEGRTVFVIAHRLSTVRNSDCIVVIEHGEIEEKGSHEELLEQKGRYYQLYTGQFQLS
ncbi:ABC transporter ATP-binding protein [Pseudoflavonifractor sp. MCC625]|uniref:ABC transporter ATP-binding protein n=1 Tax=Pseudoflavonifractor sp. MCC625 TaxID=2592647 RepID=UPI001C0128C0|nr:ABC transporter ATP-binding protein [Pseudoflavonifractor sp. MCC625]MBT9685937.1 ATP-binding cassette domain-containing protein [Pseudoflavonifractor sp. MCC625]